MSVTRPKYVILMLGGARRVSLANHFIRSGQRRGCDVEILSYELEEEVPIASVGKVIRGLRWDDPAVVEDIRRVCTEHEVNIILPFVDGAIEIASRCKKEMPEVFIPVSEYGLCHTMFDKTEAAAAFKEAGLPIPSTYTVINAELPAIAKPRRGSASRGIHVFDDMQDLMQLENIHDYLIQEYIPNAREYTVDCYVDSNGRTLCAVPRERLETMGGEATRTRTVRIAPLEELARRTLSKFDFRGPVTLQYLYDPASGRYLLMEINPRLGGGVLCSICAGVPICDFIFEEAGGGSPAPYTDWREGTLMTRYWQEVIFHDKP